MGIEKGSFAGKPRAYIEYPGKAVEGEGKFAHVMALALDPSSGCREGIVRCIVSRSGEVGIKGNIDRSELHLVRGASRERFEIGERLAIRGETEIVKGLTPPGGDFIGLEDPDIWIDERTNMMHVYCTIPILVPTDEHIAISLGHAAGGDLRSLTMTEPALAAEGRKNSAKEVSIAPANKQGVRLNLFESHDRIGEVGYSTVRVAIAEDMGKPWRYGETVFHPVKHRLPWIAGDASPGPLLPKAFLDVGEGKMLGIMNGREARQKIGGRVKYGTFSVGLFVYDYENGKIEWVSPRPLIRDSEATTITFASQFVATGRGSGVLFAHVDDSFVRAYALDAEGIKTLLP